MNLLYYLKKQYLYENFINDINYISLDNIENDVENIINEINIEFDVDDLIINYDDIVELFNINDELELFINNEIHDKYDDIKVIFYDDVINLINNHSQYDIIENDIDEFYFYYGIELKLNQFNYYNSHDDLILYDPHIDIFKTINYYDIENYFNIDEIIDHIINNII